MIHKINLAGYNATTPGVGPSVLNLGTAGSYGIEQLQLFPDGRWNGLTITATFHPPVSKDPVRVLAGPDGLLDVPPEATTSTSTAPGKIVFAGVSDGVQRISCDLPYTVSAHSTVEGAESSATPDVLAQAIAQTGAARDEAVSAADRAEAASGSIGDGAERAEAAANKAEASAGEAGKAAESAKLSADSAEESARKAEASEPASAAQRAEAAAQQAEKDSATASKSSSDAALAALAAASANVYTGAVVWYAGQNAPKGYLLCDGSLVGRGVYPALFAAIGTAYGAGDGSTTFALPDLRGYTFDGNLLPCIKL